MNDESAQTFAYRVLDAVDEHLSGVDKYHERAANHIAALVKKAVADETSALVIAIGELKRGRIAVDTELAKLRSRTGLAAVDIVTSIVVGRHGITFADRAIGIECSFGSVPEDKGPITLFVVVPKKGGSDYERLERASVALMEAAQKARDAEVNDGG